MQVITRRDAVKQSLNTLDIGKRLINHKGAIKIYLKVAGSGTNLEWGASPG